MDSFEDYVDEIKKIEKKKVEYAPYGGKVTVSQLLDLNPDEYVELSYEGLLNMYERLQKITKTSSMLAKVSSLPAEEVGTVIAEEKKPTALSKKKEEEAKAVEETIKKISQESMEAAEKIKSASLPPEKAPSTTLPYGGEIEFEKSTQPTEKIELEKEETKPKLSTRPPLEVREIEISHEIDLSSIGKEELAERKEMEEKKIKSEVALEKEVPEETLVEKKEEEKCPIVGKEVKIVFPPVLESPDKAAEQKYKDIEKEVLAAIGEGADDVAIKKKMLELTKELFKEKSTTRREHLKLEITVLKNLLAQRKAIAPTKGKKGKVEKSEEVAHDSLLETISSTQRVELSQTKDSIMANYKNQIIPLKAKFEKALTEELNDKEKKDAYDSFVFNLTSILEHTPAVMTKYCEYLKKKHLAELSNIEKNVRKEEIALIKKINERKKEIDNYDKEFAALEDIIKKEIETLIRRGGREIFKKPEGEKTSKDLEEEKIDDIIGEIEAIDEGTLLFYLHSKDPDYYKRYERKQISKAEALSHAKSIMAREKGLSSEVIKKYFSNNVGE
ncbi:MAG: hypothetical protein QXF35_04610 [Candidatus Bilamarchaeaceae archaeon]